MKKLFTAILTAVLFFGITAAQAGEMIKFATYGGPDANAYYIPGSSGKVVIMFHDWNGLTDNVKKDVELWFEDLGGGASIYVVDLYDGKTATSEFEAKKLMNNLDSKRAEAIVNGMIQKVGSGKQIATAGYGMGGVWAFNTASMLGSKAVGCAIVSGFPVTDDARIATNKADVLYVHGRNDELVSQADVELFKSKVAATGKNFQLELLWFKHGFANVDNTASFSRVPAMEARWFSMQFLKHKLAL